MSEFRRLIRRGFGAVLAELRQRRATDKEILRRLEVIIKQTGGAHAKLESAAEDIGQLQETTSRHEREIAALKRPARQP